MTVKKKKKKDIYCTLCITVCDAVLIVLKISSEEEKHITIIYSRASQLLPHSSITFTAVRITKVGVYLEEYN